MPKIAEHCAPGGWRHKSAPHTPSCEWPEDCMVQWGGSGIVLTNNGAYRTAFFEAFPTSPSTFIRGEGATVEEAEQKALSKYKSICACPSHEFVRGRYTNGAGSCKHCNLFSSDAFEPSTTCHVCEKPTAYSMGSADGKDFWYCEEHAALRRGNGHVNPLDRLMDELEKEDPNA